MTLLKFYFPEYTDYPLKFAQTHAINVMYSHLFIYSIINGTEYILNNIISPNVSLKFRFNSLYDAVFLLLE